MPRVSMSLSLLSLVDSLPLPFFSASLSTTIMMMINVLRRSGTDVKVASVENQVGVDAFHGIKMVADALLSDVFDLIMPRCRKRLKMEELAGLLRIHVKKGINLARRDSRSSDPFVVITIGTQIVYDKDTFTSHDKMGDAQIDIKLFLEVHKLGLKELPDGTVIKRANFNDKYEEYMKKLGGGIMGLKSQAKTKAKERVLAKEAAQRMN
ncbi:hypothetical protein YC2023_000388 [Brassica napus]